MVISISIRELSDLRRLFTHILRKDYASDEILFDIQKRINDILVDVDQHIRQYQADSLWFEAVYLSQCLFDLWRQSESRVSGLVKFPPQYNPVSLVSLYEKIGDIAAAELVQEKIIFTWDFMDPHTDVKDLQSAISNLFRLYSINQQPSPNYIALTEVQKRKSILCQAIRRSPMDIANFDSETLVNSIQADIDLQNESGHTLLCLATKSRNHVLMAILLQMKANTNIKNHSLDTALHIAAINGSEASVRLLLENGVGIDEINNGAGTALHIAAVHNYSTVARILLEYGANINAKNHVEGATALHLAAGRSHKHFIHMLLESGAGVNEKNNRGETALHVAARHSLPSLDVFLRYGVNVDLKNDVGETAIHVAAYGGFTRTLQTLSDHGNVNIKDNRGKAAIHVAAHQGLDDMLEALFEHEVNVDLRDNSGDSAIHIAIERGFVSTLNLLLDKEANINLRDNEGNTGIHLAIYQDSNDMLAVLLQHGANTELKNKYGEAAIHLAARRNSLSMLQLLLQHGAKVDAKSEYEVTALCIAMLEGLEETERLLLEAGADAKVADNMFRSLTQDGEGSGYIIQKTVHMMPKTVGMVLKKKGFSALPIGGINFPNSPGGNKRSLLIPSSVLTQPSNHQNLA